MPDREIVGPDHRRSMRMSAPEEAGERELWISVSSEEPAEQWFGTEVLDHSARSVDLDFFGGGTAPLLLDHDPRRQIGVVEEARLDQDTRRLRAKVRFSKNPMASEVFDDVMDGIRMNVSVGYSINKTERDEKTEVVTVREWSPMEVSIVSIPADKTVGVGRAQTDIEPETKPSEVRKMPDIDIDKVRADAIADAERKHADDISQRDAAANERIEALRNEASEIMSLGARKNMSDKAAEFVKEGRSLSEFRGYVLEQTDNAPLETNDIGMGAREINDFSIMNLVRASGGGRSEVEAARMEIEACQAAADQLKDVKTQGFRIPMEVMRNWGQRDLAAGTDTQLVPTMHESGMFIQALRNASSVMQAGPTILDGLSGNVDIPAENAVSSAAWVSSEGTNATESEGTFRTVSLTPNDVAMYTDMTRRMIQQSSPAIEGIVRDQIVKALALTIDLAALEGSGSGGEPEGVLNTTGIGKPTAFAAENPTFAELVALETEVANDNALVGSLAYIGTTAMWGALKTTTKDSGSGQFVAEADGTTNGYRYIKSNQGTSGNLYFGNWADLLLGMWGGLDLMVDDSALALSGGKRLIAFQTVDVAVRHAESFAYNNDT